MKILTRWLLLAAALLLVAHLYPGVSVQSFGSAMIAALVLGLLNAVVRPVLVVLTLPVTIVTIGLFLFLLLIFIRVLPMISIFEMRTLLPEAHVHGESAGDGEARKEART